VAPPVEEKVPKPPIDLSLECIDTEEEEITLESDSEDPTYVVLHWDAFDTAIGSLCICCRWWPSGQQAGEDGAQSEEVLELAADLQVDDMINDRGQAPILLWDDRESVAFDWTPPVALPERNSGSQADLGRCSVVSNFEKGPRPGAWSLRLAWHCGKPEDRRDIPRAIQATVQLGLLGGRSRWMTAGSLRSRQHVGGSKCFDIPLRESLEAQSGSPQQQRIRETRRDIAGLRVRRRRSERRVEHDARLIEKCSAELKDMPSAEAVEEIRDQIILQASQRRATHEELMNLRGRIRTFCRIRGLCPGDAKSSGSSGVEAVTRGALAKEVIVTSLQRRFDFDLVFGPEAPTERIWEEVWPLVDSVFDQPGSHACVMAYGQTGAGKTFTMEGNADQPGLVKRTLERLYARKEGRLRLTTCNRETEVSVSMLEIYQEHLFDLLSGSSCSSHALAAARDNVDENDEGVAWTSTAAPLMNQRLQLRQDGGEFGPEVKGLRVVRPASCAEALALYQAGARQRRLGASERNARSSRSHMVFCIQVAHVDKNTGELSAPSKISLVDLAGSERQRSAAALDRVRIGEACSINRSLTTLGKVVQACVQRASAGKQSERERTHVPYRDSVLTRLLSDSIGGQAKTLLVAHVTPLEIDVQESYRTLQFAAAAACVQEGVASRNDDERCQRQAARLQAENERVLTDLQDVGERRRMREQKQVQSIQASRSSQWLLESGTEGKENSLAAKASGSLMKVSAASMKQARQYEVPVAVVAVADQFQPARQRLAAARSVPVPVSSPWNLM